MSIMNEYLVIVLLTFGLAFFLPAASPQVDAQRQSPGDGFWM